MPGVDASILRQILTVAGKEGIPCMVLIDSWTRAAEALRCGTRVLVGLPPGRLPQSLLEAMRQSKCAFAPRLDGSLEKGRLRFEAGALEDPYLRLGVGAQILSSFTGNSPSSQVLEEERAWRERQKEAFENLRRLEASKIELLNFSDAGFAAGAFQGYSSYMNQRWMEEAGLQAWTRLEASTTNAASLLGRSVGFGTGEAADFMVLGQDPRSSADALKQIRYLICRGELVDPTSLLPDYTRGHFHSAF